MSISRAELTKAVGEESVKNLESQHVYFTNRVTDGTHYQGYTEFAADLDLGDDTAIKMYVFVDSNLVDVVEVLDQIDWDTAIENAEFELLH